MSGLIKPPTQRGRPFLSTRRRNPAINHIAIAKNTGGIVCASSRGNNDSLFISSYHEDKKEKYRQQMKARAKKSFALVALGVVMVALVSSRSSSVSGDAIVALRSGRPPPIKTKIGSKADEPPKAPETKITPKADGPPPPKCIPVSHPIPEGLHIYKTHNIEKGPAEYICGRKIPINLSDESTWHTPSTKSLDWPKISPDIKEVVLLKNDGTYGNMGAEFNSFFHAFDVAYDKKVPLILTQDAWVIKTLSPLFFGPNGMVEKNAAFYSTIENVLGVKFVIDEADLKAKGISNSIHKNPSGLFYTVTKSLTSEEIRNRRDTILRKLFLYPSQYGNENVCNTYHTLVGDDHKKKYTVIHMADPAVKNYLSKLNQATGEDQTAATEMKPEYVKNILKQVGMLEHDIFPIDANKNAIDHDAHTRLLKDPDLAGHIKCVEHAGDSHLGGNMYLAVLADVYIGNPVDQMSLWVARMRFALGIKNTFIFTEKKGDQWVSYFNDETYLYLYDSQKLGTPWMG